ncbi:MAG: helix-turn-helix domain-containing protein [Bradymonadaceae bacterium]
MVREARKSLGLSLADVAAMTRIPKTMLKHLESDRYDEYSAEVFARGHLRNYAREVQLEPEIVLQAFDRYTGKLTSDPEVDEQADESIPPSNADEAPFWDVDIGAIQRHVQPAHLVAVGLVLVALFVVFGMLTGSRATAQKPNEFPEAAATTSDDWEMEKETEKSKWLLEKQNSGAESSGQ